MNCSLREVRLVLTYIEPKAGASVPVAVWETTADDELALDRYEGYPTFYYKAEMTSADNGNQIRQGKGTKGICVHHA